MKIGELNVTEEMKKQNGVIGGEGNGGVIYPRLNFARNSLVGMALILHLLAETGQTFTELVNSLPRFAMIKEKLACPSDKIPRVQIIVDPYEKMLDQRCLKVYCSQHEQIARAFFKGSRFR